MLLIAVLAFLSAALLLFWFSKRQTPKISQNDRFQFDLPNPRPLFAPTEQDLKRERDEAKAIKIARREYLAKKEARAIVDEILLKWRERPSANNTVQLLRAAAESGLEGDLTRAADEIINLFRKSGIDGVSAISLAALIDSHIHLLSDTERSSGAVFWLKQEVAKLNSGENTDN